MQRRNVFCFFFFWNGTEYSGQTGKLLEQLRDCLLPALDSSRRASSVSSSSQKSTSEMDEDRETKLVVETGWPASSDRRFRRVSDAPLAPLRVFFLFLHRGERVGRSHTTTTSRCGRHLFYDRNRNMHIEKERKNIYILCIHVYIFSGVCVCVCVWPIIDSSSPRVGGQKALASRQKNKVTKFWKGHAIGSTKHNSRTQSIDRHEDDTQIAHTHTHTHKKGRWDSKKKKFWYFVDIFFFCEELWLTWRQTRTTGCLACVTRTAHVDLILNFVTTAAIGTTKFCFYDVISWKKDNKIKKIRDCCMECVCFSLK